MMTEIIYAVLGVALLCGVVWLFVFEPRTAIHDR
jgi:hypothetical protein